jgi:LuxR family maltose regulon positive regulatory protein
LAAELHFNSSQGRLAVRSLTLAILAVSRSRLVWPFYERLATVGQIIAQAKPKDFCFIQPEEIALLEDLRDAYSAADRDGAVSRVVRAEPSGVSAEVGLLTPRELQLLKFVALGLDNQLIAGRVSLTVPTVKWHLYNLYAKLQVKSRAAAIAKARALNLLPR